MKNKEKMSSRNIAGILILFLLAFFCGFSPVYAQRDPIDIHLIIDSSSSLAPVRDEITSWIFSRLDQILVNGDRVTAWSAGASARVIYSGRMDNNSERDTLNRSIREITPSGDTADLSGALIDAASQQSTPYGYTLLISVSSSSLSSLISGQQGNLLRFSRVEEYTSWRALVIGLNLNTRVSRAASAFFR